MIERSCIICGSAPLTPKHDYLRCAGCAHEVLAVDEGQTYIVNDPLDISEADRMTSLDRFKNGILRRWLIGDNVLVDFGSASGKFLYQNRGLFRTAMGIEVTSDAVTFSRERLGLEIRATVEDLPSGIDVVTCWHSLEHVPADELHGVVAGIAGRLSHRGRVIVSVPNVSSFQYQLLGRDYAFYDVPNHHHQFSIRSLDRLMAGVGLRRIQLAFSGIYDLFGWVQGAINLVGGGHNYLYYRMKRRSGPDNPLLTMGHTMLLPLVTAPALLFALADSAFFERQGVITACYERNRF